MLPAAVLGELALTLGHRAASAMSHSALQLISARTQLAHQ